MSSDKLNRSERKRQLKRDAIIAKAEELFITNGFQDTKVDDIAFEVGYTKATVYNHFESKEDLFAELISKIYDLMTDSITTYLENKKTFNDIRTLGKAYFDFVAKYPDKTGLVDSGICVSINQRIIEKQFQGQNLSESELLFKNSEDRLAELMINVIAKFVANSGLEISKKTDNFIKALSAVNFMIREVIRRGRVTRQPEEEIKDVLSIIFSIIEQGVKYYVEKRQEKQN